MRLSWIGAAGLVVVLALIAFMSPSERTQSQPQDQPNIIVILFDDAAKADVELMPNVKSLIADRGATFDNFYTTHPICCPSRATILTGEYVHNHRVVSNNDGANRFRKKGHEKRTVATELQSLGYRTGLFGKYLNHYDRAHNNHRHVPRSWNRWFGKLSQRHYDYEVNDQGEIKRRGRGRNDYGDTVVTNKAATWIENEVRRPVPVFAFVSVFAPHAPFTEPPGREDDFRGEQPASIDNPSFNESDVSDKPAHIRERPRLSKTQKETIKQRHRSRLRMMLETDDFVKDLIERISEELDNTYIFVTSDNGWMQGEHRIPQKKSHPYEESVHLPLFVRGPGISAGVRVDELASMIDLFGTFSDLSGGDETRDGRSLVPLLNGTAQGWRDQLLIERLVSGGNLPSYAGVVTEQYKYLEYGTGEEELYDLTADPYEVNSLHDSADGSLLSSLRAKLDALKTCRGESCRTADSS